MRNIQHSYGGHGPYSTASLDRDRLAQLPGSDQGLTVGREWVPSLAAGTPQ